MAGVGAIRPHYDYRRTPLGHVTAAGALRRLQTSPNVQASHQLLGPFTASMAGSGKEQPFDERRAGGIRTHTGAQRDHGR